MSISSAGIGSNLDVESIITSLMGVERKPLTNATTQKTVFQSKLTAYGTLKSALASFQTSLSSLSSASKFNAQSATIADTALLKATANGNATNGNYAVNVTQLAQTNKIAAAGFSSLGDVVGSGSFTISFGTYDAIGNTFSANTTKAASTITIDASNNTLAGVRDAINAANGGVTATIVNDGQTNGNRLVITSKESGIANSVKITVNDTGDASNTDNAGLSRLAYDPTATLGNGKNLSQLQEAKNALLTIDGIAVSKPSNTITDAIEGVTLNLLKVGTSASNLNVTRDATTIKDSVSAFVKAFSDLNTTVRTLTKYDESGKSNGALLGDSATRTMITQLKQMLTSTLGGSTLNSLSQIGVSFQRDGTLALDAAKLTTAIDNNASEIAGLFSATGKATDFLLSFTGNSNKTQAGNYAVNVTQLATQGILTAGSSPNLTITAGVNDYLELNIDSINYTLNLTPGTYASAQDLANELQSRIKEAGSSATATLSGGAVKLTSMNYGASSILSITGGNAANDLFATPSAVAGLDVKGTVNGLVAIGLGQTLKGATGDASEGLLVKVSGGSLGARGSVSFAMGYAYQLNSMVTKFLDLDGLLETKTSGINSSITRLTKQQDAINLRLVAIEKRFRAQFTALDTIIGKMTTTSTFLTQQLAQIKSNNDSSN